MQKLRVAGIRKTFGPVVAVDDVSFEVEAGQMLTLLGPSGCGKTTTLRIIAGLEQGDAGEVQLGDRLLSSSEQKLFVPPERRHMGMVFQNYAVWPHMTVSENVAFPLKMLKYSGAEIRTRVQDALKLVGLVGLDTRSATALSGGQQQRVALARALVAEPEVLLLDEPLSNLDARLREELRFELRALQRDLGITAVFVTHDQKEAMVLSDRIIVMNAGHIEQEGSPTQVYQRPATPFTLEFLGQCNYVQARIVEARDGQCVAEVPAAGNARVVLEGAQWATGAEGQLSFRPEDVTLHPADGADGQWRGEVLTAAYLGNQFEYVIRLGDAKLFAVTTKYEEVALGASVVLEVRPGACSFWPAGIDGGVDLRAATAPSNG